MKTQEIQAKKESLALKKANLKQKERLLMEQERKLRTRKLIKIGEIASKVGIDDLDTPTLMGAFLEIKERSSSIETLKKWTEQGKALLQNDQSTASQQLIISFNSTPEDETKTVLKNNKFQWNPFRKEWYGSGNMEEIERILANKQAKIEIVQLED